MTSSGIDPFASVAELLASLRRGEVRSCELAGLYLERIHRFNPELNAVVTLDEERTRTAAAAADARRGSGSDAPLLGVPLTVKDAIDVQGMPTTSGVEERAAAVPSMDAPVVRNARRAGGVILGKTNTPPYVSHWQTDNKLFGRSNNPWDGTRTPGGSTGGGAAAVAAGLSPLEIGSDIGGSIRVPAAFCGIYGHRPSETVIPRSGHYPGSSLPNWGAALNVIGPLARSAADLELALDVLSGAEPGEDVAWRLQLPPARQHRLADFRVAVLPPIPWLPVDDEILHALDRLAGRLRTLGATVATAQPEPFGDMREHHRTYSAFLTANFDFMMGTTQEKQAENAAQLEGADDEFERARARGMLATAADYLTMHRTREQYRDAYRAFFRDWDVLLAPVAPVVAFPHIARPWSGNVLAVNDEHIPYARLSVYPGVATLSGQPATAFPAGFTSAGLPIGLQAIGPYLEDRTAIRFAQFVEGEFGLYRRPPGFD